MANSNSTSIDGFIIRPSVEGQSFITEFLASPDFDIDTLRSICRKHGLRGYSGSGKRTLAELLARDAVNNSLLKQTILESVFGSFKNWLSIKSGKVGVVVNALDPIKLITEAGEEKWYGPVSVPNEDGEWYIRPIFLPHWENLGSHEENANNNGQRTLTESKVRWLCFARIASNYASIHWRGAYHSAEDARKAQGVKTQAATWQHIPKLFQELERMTQSRFDDIKLHQFVLFYLWEKYRYDKKNYEWNDIRIRCETAGVKLNARSSTGAKSDLDKKQIQGIKKLANTIRTAIFHELAQAENIVPQKSEFYDEVILRTLIQDFGALSYEFEIKANARKFFRTHSYFGMHPEQETPDAFAHMRIFKSYGTYLEQLKFLTQHLDDSNESHHDQVEQRSLF